MQKTERMNKSNCGQLLSWLPVAASVALAIALIAKGSIASLPRTSQGTIPVGNMQSEPRPLTLGFDDDSLVAPGIKEGRWSIEGANWDFQNETITTEQLAGNLRQACETGIASDHAEHLAVIDLIPAARAQISKDGTLVTRSIDFGTAQTAVIYREVGNRNSLVCAKIANRIDTGRWQLVTLSPKAIAVKSSDHLMPIDGLGNAVCQRFANSGALQCEIVETVHTMDSLVEYWRFHGWSLQRFSSSDSDSTQIWNCSKGDQFVQVKSTRNSVPEKSTLTITSIKNL